QYDDLYSILLRIRHRLPVVSKAKPSDAPQAIDVLPSQIVSLPPEDLEQDFRSELVSDHVRMQWKLLSLGLKTGAKVWVPVADQGRIRATYEYDDFEKEFSTGIDLPHSYIENIDVVWKEE